jgi:L-ascorbate metabolism protein UlaG (beta-lactamase superfamily)
MQPATSSERTRSLTPAPDLTLTYIGHATNLIDMDGVRLLTDPLLRNQIAHLRRAHLLADISSYHPVDAVLISHLHHDHCDYGSLRLLGRDVRLIVPQGAGALLAKWGFTHVEEIAVGDTVTVNGLTITATPAVHGGFRPPFGPTTLPLGFVIRGSRGLYFAGDTDIFPEMADLPRGLDVALLPVWGWGPTLGKGHLDPHEAARALKLIEPQIAVPIHWGAFAPIGLHWLRMPFMRVPPALFAHHAKDIAPDVDVRILPPGGTLALPEGDDSNE